MRFLKPGVFTLRSILFFLLSVQNLYAQTNINSFSPASGGIGTTVTITGNNFDPIAANNIVYFGNVKSAVSSASISSLVVTVPIGAAYMPISVTTPQGTAYSSLPFIVTFAGGANISSSTFSPPGEFGTYRASHIKIADIDGDGKMDVVLLNLYQEIYILRNTSKGSIVSFDTPVVLQDICAYKFKIADIDGDGKQDLIVPGYCNNVVSIFRNTSTAGVISFSSKVDFPAADWPYAADVANLNDDNKPDVVVVNLEGRSISVFKNLSTPGIISLSPRIDYGVGDQPRNVALTDIDGDGKTDLAVTNQGSNSISVFRNTNSGTAISFAPKIDFTTLPGYPEQILNGDVDGDGKPDLVVTGNNVTGNVNLFRNTSTPGNISLALTSLNPYASYPYNEVLTDINGDGKPDLAVTEQFNGTVSIFQNTSNKGNITFAPKVDFSTSSTEREFIEAGDINGDGKPDLVVSYFGIQKILIYLNQVSPPIITSFSPKQGPVGTTVTISGSNFSSSISDNTVFFGATEAKVTSASNNTLTVIVPQGSTFQPIYVTTNQLTAYSSSPFLVTYLTKCFNANPNYSVAAKYITSAYPRHITSSDLDADGKPDLIVTNNLASGFSIFKNTGGSGKISLGPAINFIAGTTPFATATGDLDGDGKPDVVTASYSDNTVSIYRNTSIPGIISLDAKIDLPTGLNPIYMAISDLDNDGKPDLVLVNNNANSISIFRNISKGNISFAPRVDFPVGEWPINFFLADLDGDNFVDIVAVNHDDNSVSILRNTSKAGSISFALEKILSTGKEPFWVTAGDLDADGKPEIVVANSADNTISIYKNSGSPGNIVFNNPVIMALGNTPLHVGIYDINGNGKPDLAVINFGSNSISIINNKSLPGNLSFDAPINFNTGGLPRAVVIADLDGDNLPEMAVVNSIDNTLVILKNTDINSNGPVINQTETVATDCSNTSGELKIQSTGGTLPVEYSINGKNFQQGNLFTGLGAGTYNVLIQDASGCQATAEAAITLKNNFKVDAGADTVICEGTSIQLNGSSLGTKNLWTSTIPVNNSGSLKPIVSPSVTTIFTFKSEFGICSDSDQIVVSVNQAPYASAGNDTIICAGSNQKLQAEGGFKSYEWTPSLYLDNSEVADPVVRQPPLGKYRYQLIVVDSNNCRSLKAGSVVLTVTEARIFAGNDTSVFGNQPFQLNVVDLNNFILTSVTWSPSLGINDIHSEHPVGILHSDQIYKVSATTSIGCKGSSSITVKVFGAAEIFVPNAFTPNGDGKNDLLKPLPSGLKSFTRFTIYNRWGQIIFSSTNSSDGWNGRINDKVQIGTYVWVAQGIDKRGNTILRKGTVVVMQ